MNVIKKFPTTNGHLVILAVEDDNSYFIGKAYGDAKMVIERSKFSGIYNLVKGTSNQELKDKFALAIENTEKGRMFG